MAKQQINIGVEGNDGTGDSIRESFKKVNENFTELYAVFGVGGQINFTTLSDTPDSLTPDTVPLVNNSGTQLTLATLASNAALGGGATDTITFSYAVPGKLIISSAFTKVSDDLSPTLGGPLNAAGFGIANPGISSAIADAVNAAHDGVSNITVDDLVITKGYADQRYITSGLPLRVADEPTGRLHYTWTINTYVDNALEITSHYDVSQGLVSGGHGLESGANGLPIKFTAEDTDPTGLTTGTTYYLRVVSPTRLYLYTEANKAYATTDVDADALAYKINVSGTISADDTHTITDAALDTNLSGNFLDDVGMPRKSVTRRQGDTMTGPLYLHDHPGELAGEGAPNGVEDLQAASKFYVDNTSYSSPEVLHVSTGGDDTMAGVPAGKEGTSFTYAFKTINAAAQRADILMRSAPVVPGSYMQKVTHSGGTAEARVIRADVVTPVYLQARNLTEKNRRFIIAEVQAFLKYTYPNFAYDISLCERDVGLIADSIALDINRGLNTNYLVRQAAERYYSSVSGRIAITSQLTQTLAAINFAKELHLATLQNNLLQQQNISAITRANPGRVTTSANHGWADKNIVLIKNVGGMTEIEGQKKYIKKISDDTFELYNDAALTLPYDTSAFTGFTSGGIAGLLYQTDEAQYLDDGLVNIATATKTYPVRITTSASHFVESNDTITIQSVGGMTNLNGNTYTARRVDASTLDLYSTAFNQKTVSNATQTNPVRVTTLEAHGLSSSNEIAITEVSGMTELNQTKFYVSVINSTQFDLYTDSGLSSSVDGTGYGAWTSGGFVTSNAVDGTGFGTYTSGGTITKATDADTSAVTAISDKWELIKTIITNGIDAGADIVYGSTYKIILTNGTSSYVDQTNPNNTDLLPGKVIRGRRSEALGQIVSFTNGVSAEAGIDPVTGASEPNPTMVEVHLLSPKDFEDEEDVEFGNFVKEKQVTIRVETGVYEEDYPIKLSNNVSLKGDEFRRVIIKPKTETDSKQARVSQSKWAQTYFYRDNEFDGLQVARGGTPFLNQEGTEQGKFGYHYLYRPEKPINVGGAIVNPGKYTTAAAVMKANRDYIIEETIQLIADRFPLLVYSEAKCRRDTGMIIDALIKDLTNGGEEGTLETQGSYHELGYTELLTQLGDSTQETATEDAIQNISLLANSLLSGVAPTYTDSISQFTPVAGDNIGTDTPTGATYNGNTGDMVLTMNNHGLVVDDLITIATNGIAFTCTLDGGSSVKTYPRTTDPVYNRFIRVSAADANTITVNVGASNLADVYGHTFNAGGTTADCVTKYRMPTKYNSSTGDLQVNIGSHNLKVGQTIKVDNNGLSFICDSDDHNVTRSYPQIRSFTPTTGTTYNPTTGVMNLRLFTPEEFTPSGGTYEPTTGDMQLTIGAHTFAVGDYVMIDDNGVTFTCTMAPGNHTYPRPSDPASEKALPIIAFDGTSITVNVGASPEGQQYAHTFVTAASNCVKKAHSLKIGEKIRIAANSLTFGCTFGSGGNKTYPRATGEGVNSGTPDPAYGTELPITAVTNSDIQVNVLAVTPSTNVDTHTFISATAGAVTTEDPSYQKQRPITSTTATTFTINVGSSPVGNQYTHTFKSATANAIDYGGTYTAGQAAVLAKETPDISLGAAEAGTGTLVGNLIDKICYVFNVEHNPPLRNDQLDVFMMGDQTIIRNVTCRGHGGFMCVLDPEGQVLVKSPYIQTASSFSQSLNKKAFRGGMYVDAYVGNLPTTVLTKVNNFKITVQSNAGEGLRLRPPQLPCPFYVEGRRYQVNAISDYDKGQGTATLYLDANSNNGSGYDETQFTDSSVSRAIFLQTAGNRSILGNDFTQINDLGYGLVTNNAAFSEMVSMFTYYCHAAYYANNGSEIRSLNGSNGYGNFGLIAEGADPNEIPDQVTLTHDMVQPIKAYVDGTYQNALDDPSITVYDLKRPPTAQSLITIDHGGATGTLDYVVASVTNLSDQDGDGILGEGSDILISGAATVGSASGTLTASPSAPYTLTAVDTTTVTGTGSGLKLDISVTGGLPGTPSATYTVTTKGEGYAVGDQIKVLGTAFGGTNATPTNDITLQIASIIGSTNNATHNNLIYKLDLKADDVEADNFFGTLQTSVANNTVIEYRDRFQHQFDNVNSPSELVTRPSTAINFDESDGATYRSISFQSTDAFSQPLASNKILSTFEAGYDFVQMEVSTSHLTGGYGSAQGDTRIAISPLVAGTAGTVVIKTTGNISINAGETLTQTGSTGSGTVVNTVSSGDIIVVSGVTGAYNKTGILQGSTSGGLGSTSIPTTITINEGSDTFSDTARIVKDSSVQPARAPGDAGYAGGMRFLWKSKTHRVLDYKTVSEITTTGNITVNKDETLTQAISGATAKVVKDVTAGTTIYVYDVDGTFDTTNTITGSGSGALGANSVPTTSIVDNVFAFIDIGDVSGSNINTATYSGGGIHEAIPAASRTLTAGIGTGATAEITVSISLLRATGHDFTQIGTGGFNDSNYPNVILGDPVNSNAEFYTDANTATSSQVWERRKGRVFFVSTDQNGFFRVGKFFSVDQATGDITFAGEIGLSNANALGFKKGVTINEFSADDSFADDSGQAVPTEKAIGNYINRALGFNVKSGAQIPGSSNRIGPGFLPLNGLSNMEGNLDMGTNLIQNVSNPASGTDATNKNYVDDNVENYNRVGFQRDFVEDTPSGSEMLVSTGNKILYAGPPTVGSGFVSGDVINNTLSGGSATGTIVTITASTDSQLGSVRKIVYEATSGSFSNGDTLTNGVSQHVIFTGVGVGYNEYTHVSKATGSDVALVVNKTSSANEYSLNYESGSIENADVNAGAAIAQSKLNMNAAGVLANASGISQSDLGLAAFKSSEFDSTSGWIQLQTATGTTDGIDPGKITHIGTDRVLGRSLAGDGAVSAITFDTVLDEGGAVRDSEFPAYSSGTDVLLRTAASTYGVKSLSDASTGDTVVLRKSAGTGIKAGAIQAEALILGGDATYEVLGLDSTTLQVKTPGQATILEASGTSNITVSMPGNLDIGETGFTGSESNFQTASTFGSNSFLGVDWIYSSFIEAPGEKDANGTGISIGAGTGFADSAADTILFVTGGSVRLKTNDTETEITGNLVPDGDNTRNLGGGSLKWNTVYASTFSGTATSAQYADLAENYLADKEYECGTVLVLGGEQEVTTTIYKSDRKVVGVVSEHPAHLMNSDLQGEHVVAIALQGRVPCKILGKVQKGDIVVTSAIEGYGIVDNNPVVGTVIGKAIGTKDDDGYGVVEVLVGRV